MILRPVQDVMMRFRSLERCDGLVVIGLIGTLTASAVVSSAASVPQRVSVATDGAQSDGDSYNPVISADGRFVVFESKATNLIAGQPVGRTFTQVYAYDRLTRALTRESVGPGGVAGDSSSMSPAVSNSGRFVSFTSRATNLSTSPGAGGSSYYLRDRDAGQTVSARHPQDGLTWFDPLSGTALSEDGRYLSFVSYLLSPVASERLFTVDRTNGTIAQESLAENSIRLIGVGSHDFSLSRDGRYLAFIAYPSTGTNILRVKDTLTGEVTTESISPTGAPTLLPSNPSLSADGRFVAFVAFDFTGVLLRDRQARRTTLIPSDIRVVAPRLSSDARFVSYMTILNRCTVYDTLGAVYVDVGPANDCSAVVGGSVAFSTNRPLAPEDTNGTSDIYIAAIDVQPIGPPMNLSNAVTGTILTLSWTTPLGQVPSAYVIEAGSSPGANDIASITTTTNATTFSANASRGVTYYLRVRATYGAVVSDPSNEIVVTLSTDSPGVARSISASTAGSTVTLTWVPPQSGGPVTSYRIEAGSAYGTTDIVTFDTGNTLPTYTATAVRPGIYYVRVRAVNAAGIGPPSLDTVVSVSPR
jgi:hypothetical protein